MKFQATGSVALGGSRIMDVVTAKRPKKERSIFRIIRQAMPFTNSYEVNVYRLKNLPNIWRGFWKIAIAEVLAIPTHYGAVYATVKRGSGEIVELGLISLRVITDTGVAFIVDACQNTKEMENLKYHGYGTGTTNEGASQTALVTELTTEYPTDNTRPTGSTTEGPTANIYRSVGTLDPDADVAITEHAIFDQAANSGGTMLDRSKFTAINLSGSGGDTLQTTYDMTLTSGS